MLTPKQSATLVAHLEKQGWKIKGDLIYSPNEGLWFPFPEGWKDTLSDLKETMIRRLNGFKTGEASTHLKEPLLSELVSDHESAIEAIDATLTDLENL